MSMTPKRRNDTYVLPLLILKIVHDSYRNSKNVNMFVLVQCSVTNVIGAFFRCLLSYKFGRNIFPNERNLSDNFFVFDKNLTLNPVIIFAVAQQKHIAF